MLRRTIKAILILTVVLILASCSMDSDQGKVSNENPTNNENSLEEENNEVKEETEDETEAIMEEFESLISKDTTPKDLLEFIDANINKVSKEQGAMMIEELEKIQKKYREQYEATIMDSEKNINFYEIFGFDFDREKIKEIDDEEVRNIFDGGYKLSAEEGMYYLIIDYGYLKKYSEYITDEMKDYINIMALESDKPASLDAGLTITWDELGERCIDAEKYFVSYPDSPRKNAVLDRYTYYLRMYMAGLDNTDIYDYNTKKLSNEVKESYEKIILENKDSVTAEILREYLDYLKKNDWQIKKDNYTVVNNLIIKRFGKK